MPLASSMSGQAKAKQLSEKVAKLIEPFVQVRTQMFDPSASDDAGPQGHAEVPGRLPDRQATEVPRGQAEPIPLPARDGDEIRKLAKGEKDPETGKKPELKKEDEAAVKAAEGLMTRDLECHVHAVKFFKTVPNNTKADAADFAVLLAKADKDGVKYPPDAVRQLIERETDAT